MVQTNSGVIISSSGSEARVSEARRTRLDFVLAACICMAAVSYWFWDTKGNAGLAGTLANVLPAQSTPNDFNEDGFRLYSASNYVAAEALFRKAIRVNPKGAVGFCNLGAALIAQRRFDEAIAALQIAISLDPSLTLAQNNLNWALEEKAKRGK